MPMAAPLKGLVAILVGLPGVALAWFALPHFQNGLALDSAIPVPNYMIRQAPMPPVAYKRAASALARANAEDGTAQVAQAEASIDGGEPGAKQIARLEQGVRDAPPVPRGWMLLSESLAPVDKTKAAKALSQALVLAPYDYWLAGLRARDAAMQWDQLDSDTRAMALRQVQLLWDDQHLRIYLFPLLSSKEGIALVTRAFSGRPDDMRALNRWLSLEQRLASSPQ